MNEQDLVSNVSKKVKNKRKKIKKERTNDPALNLINQASKKRKKTKGRKSKKARSSGVLSLNQEAGARIQGERTYNHAKRSSKAIKDGAKMAEIEIYAKKNKITITQAMVLNMQGKMV